MADDQLRYPFKYFDDVRNRWVNARYKATRAVIAERYTKWEITGPGEALPSGGGGQFQPPTG